MILREILMEKRKEVQETLAAKPLAAWRSEAERLRHANAGVFERALREAPEPMAVIAEIKRRSPSKGLLRADFDPVSLARSFEKGGAAALSVLTDVIYFGGSADYLRSVKAEVALPVLRKDFIIHEVQVYETVAMGADALLLIAGALSAEELKTLYELAGRYGLDALVETHSYEDVQKALAVGARIIGVNNRDLQTFSVDLRTTERLAPLVDDKRLLVSESGIQSHGDLLYLKALGAKAVLVGEAFMREADPGAGVAKLLGRT
ncbi:MAG: Indole-3-glycerol phosphate synthase [Candidatus Omnitrophica bacterium]|nr:Indole-3-glycerol phosphate synthase [Candidatus Omnitrophota bacterium]